MSMSRNSHKKTTRKYAAKQVNPYRTAAPRRAMSRQARSIRSVRGASPAFLGALLIAFLLATLLLWHAARLGSASAASGTGGQGGHGAVAGHAKGWCGQAGQPACPDASPDWIALGYTTPTPGDIVAAMQKANIFSGIESRFGDVAFDLPALVLPYHPADPTAGSDYYVDDHWVVSVRDNTGREVGIFDFVYDRANERIRFASYGVLSPKDVGYGHAFPLVSPGEAITSVQTARHVVMLAGSAARLVFFPLASDRQGPEAPHPWTGGGDSPMDPLWLVAGADGHNYFVGQNLQTYAQGDLPIAGR